MKFRNIYSVKGTYHTSELRNTSLPKRSLSSTTGWFDPLFHLHSTLHTLTAMSCIKMTCTLVECYDKSIQFQLTRFFQVSHSSLYFCSCLFHSDTCCVLSSRAVVSMALLLRNVCISISHFLTFWALQAEREGESVHVEEDTVHSTFLA